MSGQIRLPDSLEKRYMEIFNYLSGGECPSESQRFTLKQTSGNFIIQGGELFLGKKKVVKSEAEAKKIFEEFHSSPIGGHAGIGRTQTAISAKFFWQGMNADIEKWIYECGKCLVEKPKLSTQPSPLTLLAPMRSSSHLPLLAPKHSSYLLPLLAPKPVLSAPKPVLLAPKPVLLAPKPVLSAPKPVLSASQPLQAPLLVVSAPKPVLSAPLPVLSAPQPVVSAPQPVVSAPQPVVSAPQPVVSAPQPLFAPRPTSSSQPASSSKPASSSQPTPVPQLLLVHQPSPAPHPSPTSQPVQCVKVSAVWEFVGVDITGPWPKTEEGFEFILTATDYFSKWVEAFPLKTKSVAEVGRHVCSMIYRHGCPRRILCDQGKLFVEQLNVWMCGALGIDRSLITAYDSQINGLGERTNDNLKRFIRKLVQKKGNNWDADLEATLFSLRSKIQTTTKYSPFLLLYGREALFPSEVPVDFPLLSNIVLPDEHTYSKFLEEREISMKKIKEVTITNIMKGQIKQKMYNEKRTVLKRQKTSSSAGDEYTTFPLSSHDIPGSPHSVHILMEGYCKDMSNDRFQADGSVTLIRGPLTVLVDTAGPWSRDFLICSLQIHGVSPEDVTHVICTHGHSDHVGNLNLFTKAEILVSYDLWRDGAYVSHDFRSGEPYLLPGGEGLKVVPTPGHTGSDVTLLVPGTSLGIVAITGDLFEREGDEDTWRNLSENPEIQEKSRRNILGFADVIVPGHGPPFRVIRNGQEPETT